LTPSSPAREAPRHERAFPGFSRHLDAGHRDAGARYAPAGFRQEAISDLGNPKMAVFFTSLLPQFTGDGGANFAALVELGLVFSLLTFIWLALYAAAIARAGAVLVALGLRIAAEHR
jgi:threonine/homoserine/homoserine lactone efflux protein